MNVLVLLAFLSSVVAQSSFKIHHRIFHPSLQPFPYTERGTLIITGHSATFQPSPSIPNDFAAFFDLLQSLESPEHALYQVALGNAGDDQWDFSSVKVCHLHTMSTDSLHLHFPDYLSTEPFAMDYFVSPTPHDGSCPQLAKRKGKSQAMNTSPFHAFTAGGLSLNTTIFLKKPIAPPLPELRTPPPLTPEGEVVQPVPERSFLQKYWMYLAAVLVALLLSGGPEEEQPRQGAK